jgi:predicted permease
MLAQDLRYALRSLVQRPGVSSIIVLTLALGIGGTSAILSVVNTVLLKPLPYGEVERVVMVWSRWKGWDKTLVSEAELLDYRERSETLSAIAAWAEGSVNLTGRAEPERVRAARVTANLFSVLGVDALVGRTFVDEEDSPGRDQVAILGHSLWRRQFSGDPGIVGQAVPIDGRPRTVVGVMPAGFRLPLDYQAEGPTEIWVPLVIQRAGPDRGGHYLYAAARLRAGVTAERANADLKAITTRLTEEGLYHHEMRFEAFAIPMTEEVLGGVRPALLVLLAAVGFLLLIACANVANLFLARSEARQREIAVRSALGAGRARIVRQLLVESLVLALFAGAVGAAIAFGGTRMLAGLQLSQVPRLGEIALDGRVLLATLVISLWTGLVFGLAPAIQASRPGMVSSLREGLGSTAGPSAQRFRSLMVAGEMALTVLLLLVATLLLRSFWALSRIDPGFQPSHVHTLRLSLPEAAYPDPGDVIRLYQQLGERVGAIPGVERAGLIRLLPLTGTIGDWGIDVEGRAESPGENFKADWQVATPGYFEAMGMTLLRGRFLEEKDRSDAPLVAVVNRAMADRYWPGEDVVGKRFRLGGAQAARPWVEIMGLVGDSRHNAIDEPVKEKFFLPHAQFPRSTGSAPRSMTLVVKARSEPSALLGSIRAEIRALDPNLPISEVRSLEDVVAGALSEPRFTATLLVLFAVLSLILAAVGLYGVLSYLVGRRTQEIGIRRALGARSGEILEMVLIRGLRLSLAGTAVGMGLAFGLTRLLGSLLYGVQPRDPLTFAVIPAGILLMAFLSSLVPAYRAMRVDPVVALRTE